MTMIALLVVPLALLLAFARWNNMEDTRLEKEDRREELTRQHRRLKAEPRY